MAEYRLSRQAEFDLLSICSWTELKFGLYQANAHHAGLECSFGLLADFPRMGIAADESMPRLRRFRFQAHQILYNEEQDHIFVGALVHVRMSLNDYIID